MGGNPNDSTASSKGKGKPCPPDDKKWHPGRELCYHWKKEHDFLKMQVEMKSIAYNTEFDLLVEHCEMKRDADSMSLRPWSKGAQTIGESIKNLADGAAVCDRYTELFQQFDEKIHELTSTEDGEEKWKFNIFRNEKRFLLPQHVEEARRKPRPGSFEVILSWKSANPHAGKQQVVLFSKLNTLKFPTPEHIVKYLDRVLAPARMLDFQLRLRRVPEGTPYSQALVQVDVGEENSVKNSTDREGKVDLRLPFGKDFEAQGEGKGTDPVQLTGVAMFDVHGDLPCSICMPLVPKHTDGEVRIVLTWGQFPDDIILKVKTPEGAIQTPAQRLAADSDDQLTGKEKLPNAEFEFRPEEGGYGPISVLLRTLLPGRYHVYAKCSPYKLADKLIGWSDSNAQIYMYGVEQEQLACTHSGRFKCKKEGEEAENKKFWNVCFFEVNESGHLTITEEFNEYLDIEPGFRQFNITCKDMQGKPVANASITCTPESAAYQDMGSFSAVTDDNGIVQLNLPLGEYTAQVSHAEYLPSGSKIVVDLEPQVADATIAMVKAEYFAGTENKLVVLAWGGDARAVLKVETPGRLFETPHEADEEATYGKIAPGIAMKMRGTNPRGCMLIAPDPTCCPWADPEKAGHVEEFQYSDQIFVEYQGGDMAKSNMQLNIFSKDGIQFAAVPPPSASGEQSSFWKVCKICNGDILDENRRVPNDPTTGDVFAVRVLTARELESDQSPKPSPEVMITREGDKQPLRTYLEAMDADNAEFTTALEYKLFMPYGAYKIEAKDETWIMRMASERNPLPNLPYDHLFFSKDTYNSVGLCMASQEDLDGRSLFVSLSWADQPKDLDLCIAHADGVVSSKNAAAKPGEGAKAGNVPKGITYLPNSITDAGFGPKVVQIMQPTSAKLKVYVMDRAKQDPKTFLKCHPMVNILFFNQIWRSFTLKLPEGGHQEALDMKVDPGKAAQCCWHVCDLKIEQDTKMSENCVECTPINELLDTELKLDPS